MARVTPATGDWGLNIGGFMAAHPDWVIQGRSTGYTAQHRNASGRPRGPVLEAPSLDELAAKIEAAG
jgi:hypothetical protein